MGKTVFEYPHNRTKAQRGDISFTVFWTKEPMIQVTLIGNDDYFHTPEVHTWVTLPFKRLEKAYFAAKEYIGSDDY